MSVADLLQDHRTADAVPVIPITAATREEALTRLDAPARRWVEACGYEAKAATCCLIPGPGDALGTVLAGVAERVEPFSLPHLPGTLPAGDYFIDSEWPAADLRLTSLGWALAGYRFDRYKDHDLPTARLCVDADVDSARVRHETAAICLARDLINTPAEDMMPEHLAGVTEDLAGTFGARFDQLVGEALLSENFPAVHAVGRASVHAPRLIELNWGEPDHPEVVIVGKGVCFDSGGLDLKSAQNMRLMKKDMGGAAVAIGLARLLINESLPVRVRLLVAAVENAVSANAYRPGDIIRARNGLSIEIDNTDAEGRVILSDVLVAGGEGDPDLIVDFATLTGAARVALGTEVPAMFSNHDGLANGLLAAAQREMDPVWRLPLHQPYNELIDSPTADVVNSGSTPFGGAITAALFLERFVPAAMPWAHFDLMAWNTRSRAGRPEGGEAMSMRAVASYLAERYRDA